MGADGVAQIVRAFSGPFVIKGKNTWRFREDKPTNMYQNEHDEFFASIRKGVPINDGIRMAHSTLLAIMGRMAAYTGQEITWEQAMNSKESIVPAEVTWNTPVSVPPIAMPSAVASPAVTDVAPPLALAPQPPMRRPILQPTAPERYRVQFTMGEETHAHGTAAAADAAEPGDGYDDDDDVPDIDEIGNLEIADREESRVWSRES